MENPNRNHPKLALTVLLCGVVLVLSGCEPRDVQVPDLVGMHENAVLAVLQQSGLEKGAVSTAEHETVPAEHVIEQSPVAGSKVKKGSAVDLVVSLGHAGPPVTIVPLVNGKSEDEAASLLTDAKLSVGDINRTYDAEIPLGTVISQDPAEGTEVDEGSAVNLVISLGMPLAVKETVFIQSKATDEAEIAPGVFVKAAAGELMLSLQFDITTAQLKQLMHFIEEHSFEIIGQSAISRVLQIRKTDDDLEINSDLIALFADYPHVLSAYPNVRASIDSFEVLYEVPEESWYEDPDAPVGIAGDNLAGLSLYEAYGFEPMLVLMTKQLAPEPIEWSPRDFEGDWWINAIQAPAAWEISTGNPEVVLGIVEPDIVSGGTIDNERLNILFSDGEEGTGRGIFTPRTDHGERVTGLAAGDGADPDAVGVAWENPVALVRWRWKEDGINSFGDIGSAIERCVENNAKVINISAGPTLSRKTVATSEVLVEELQRWRDALTPFVYTAARKDTLTVWSAGNTGAGMTPDHHPRIISTDGDIIAEPTRTGDDDSPLNYVPGTTVYNDDYLLPAESKQDTAAWETNALIVGAAAPEVLTPSAPLFSDQYTATEDGGELVTHPATPGKIAQFSVLGDVVNILAPGVGVSHSPDFSPTSGTSYAAPLVAGAGALLKGINEDLQMVEVRRMLLDGANKTPFIGTGAKVGSGLLNVGRSADFALSSVAVPREEPLEATLRLDQTLSFIVDVLVPSSGTNALDVVFCMDVSGSYYDDVYNVQALASNIVSALSERVPDVYFGLTSFSDYPMFPYGSSYDGDEAYYLNLPLTKSPSEFYAAINRLKIYFGEDSPESQLEALYQMATGAGRDINGNGDYSDTGDIAPSDLGWRPGALRIVILATDASFHDSDIEPSYPGPGFQETIQALQDNHITVLGLYTGDNAQIDLQRVVDGLGRGSVHPLASDSRNIVQAISGALDTAVSTVDLSVQVLNDPNGFVQDVESLQISDVEPGESVEFTFTLRGMLNAGASADAAEFDLIAWVLSNNSGLVKRIPIKVTVPTE